MLMKAEMLMQLLAPIFLAHIPVRHSLLFRLHYTQVVDKGTREMEQIAMMCSVISSQTAARQRLPLKGPAVCLDLPQSLTRPRIYI